jgi:hypothetical protein
MYTMIFVVCASLILIIVINVYYLFSLTLQCNSINMGPNATHIFFYFVTLSTVFSVLVILRENNNSMFC